MWAEPRPTDAPARTWRDWALVAAVVGGAVVEGVLRPELPWRVASVVMVVGLAPTLLWRRTRPLPMMAIAFGATAVVPLFFGSPPTNSSLAFVLILVFALVRWGSGREIGAGALIVLAQLGSTWAIGHTATSDVGAGILILTSTAALATALRYRARSRSRELDQIRLVERERLARDLHDTVAHHVSAMAIRAQAGLATRDSDPEAADDALRVIEAEASDALAEMRTMVRALRRDEPAELAPSPGVSDLVRLAGRTRGGPVVDVDVGGDVHDLAPSVGAAIYRLAQESVTNARRHARHATRIEVRVDADESSVRLRVSDDGDAGAARSAPGRGYGLVGMIERASLLGGTCRAGPDPGRGWSVTAVLPRTGSAT